MATLAYKEAYSEVLDILSHTRKEDVEKISPQFLGYLKSNSSKNYVSTLDHSIKLKDMNLKPKTKAILAIIYRKFWCNDEQLKEFDEKLKNNEIAYKKVRQNTNIVDNHIFPFDDKKTDLQVLSNETINKVSTDNDSLIPHKESFFSKIITKLKSLFKK